MPRSLLVRWDQEEGKAQRLQPWGRRREREGEFESSLFNLDGAKAEKRLRGPLRSIRPSSEKKKEKRGEDVPRSLPRF